MQRAKFIRSSVEVYRGGSLDRKFSNFEQVKN